MILNNNEKVTGQITNNGEPLIIEETNEYVKVPITVIQEMVMKYPERSDHTNHLIDMTEFAKVTNDIRNTFERKELTIEHPTTGMVTNIQDINGHIEQAHIDGSKLRCVGVIYKNDKTREIINQLKQNRTFDVSAGYWCNVMEEGGDLNGIPYTAVQRNIVGNHVAIIMQGKGRCSYEDGCGIRTNASVENTEQNNTTTLNPGYATGTTNTNHNHTHLYGTTGTESGFENTDPTTASLSYCPPDDSIIINPYKNEHSARIHEPEGYETFRRKNDEFGTGINVIYGIKDSKTEIQSIRFDAQKFTEKQARAWLRNNDYTYIQFEPALKQNAQGDSMTDEEQVQDEKQEETNYAEEIANLRSELEKKDKVLQDILNAKHEKLNKAILERNSKLEPILENLSICDKETLLNSFDVPEPEQPVENKQSEDKTPSEFAEDEEEKEEYTGIGVPIINKYGQREWVRPDEVI
jgi:hypothetical protein